MLLLCNTSLRSADDYGKSALAAALANGDITAIKNAVAESRRALGDKSGVPEVADKYTPVPPDARWLKAAEAQPGFSKYFDKLEKMRWWRIGIDPTKLTQPLRAPAAVLSGNLAAARKKALLGVIPGQLTDGPHMGRWLDPHNARPAYHYIMLRALAQLAAVLPKDDTDRAAIVQGLELGLTVRNQEILTEGVMTKDKAIEALLLTAQVFADERTFLDESKTTAALDTLGRFVSAEALRGKLPLGPREWGMFLAHVKIRTP